MYRVDSSSTFASEDVSDDETPFVSPKRGHKNRSAPKLSGGAAECRELCGASLIGSGLGIILISVLVFVHECQHCMQRLTPIRHVQCDHCDNRSEAISIDEPMQSKMPKLRPALDMTYVKTGPGQIRKKFISQCQVWGGGRSNAPVFRSRDELIAAGWAPYFQHVYGELPTTRYPICVGSFWFLDRTALDRAGIADVVMKPCPEEPGDVYEKNNKYQPPWAAWVFHAPPYGINGVGIPANTWIEVSHMAQPRESAGAWLMFSMGSGVWFNTGKTAIFNEHAEAHKVFCGRCDGLGKKDAQMSLQAARMGFTSLQFLQHRDDQWRCKRAVRVPKGAMNIEIVAVALQGDGPCGIPRSSFRAGWNAQRDCACDSTAMFLNCQRHGPSPFAHSNFTGSAGPANVSASFGVMLH